MFSISLSFHRIAGFSRLPTYFPGAIGIDDYKRENFSSTL